MSMVKTLLNNFFKQLGVELLVDFYVNKQNEDYLKIINQMENDAKKTVDIQPTVSNTPVKKENKYVPYNSKKYNDVIALKLNEISGDLPNVSVQGYVYKTDLTKIRSGKHIQSFWITDYTDSILCKRFENARVPS